MNHELAKYQEKNREKPKWVFTRTISFFKYFTVTSFTHRKVLKYLKNQTVEHFFSSVQTNLKPFYIIFHLKVNLSLFLENLLLLFVPASFVTWFSVLKLILRLFIFILTSSLFKTAHGKSRYTRTTSEMIDDHHFFITRLLLLYNADTWEDGKESY